MNNKAFWKWIKEWPHRGRLQLTNSASFLDRLAKLIDEGYTFQEALTLLLPHHTNQYEHLLEEIDLLFRNGAAVADILGKLGFTTSLLLPVVVAEVDGNLAGAFRAISQRLVTRDEKMKKLKNIVSYPLVLFMFLSGLFVAYRQFFAPNLQSLMSSRGNEESTFVVLLPKLAARLPDVIVLSFVICLMGSLLISIYYQRLSAAGRIQFRLRLPFIRTLFMQLHARSFAEEMGNLLNAGLALQAALDVLIEQEIDKLLSALASNIRKQIAFGESFHHAILLTNGFPKELASFAKHGADRGELAKELELYATHLSEELERKMTVGLAFLQPLLFSMIAICILVAYLALLLPVYEMIDLY